MNELVTYILVTYILGCSCPLLVYKVHLHAGVKNWLILKNLYRLVAQPAEHLQEVLLLHEVFMCVVIPSPKAVMN